MDGQQVQYIRVRPNHTKITILTTLVVIGGVAGIVGIHAFLQWFADVHLISLLKQSLATFGIEVSLIGLLPQVGLLIGAALLGSILIQNVRYAHEYRFYPDRFVTPRQEVHYTNINRINFDKSGLEQKMLNCGDLIIEAGGTQEGSITINYVDNVEDMAQRLQQAVVQYKDQERLKAQQQARVENIVGQW